MAKVSKIKCVAASCGKELAMSNFYVSYSSLYRENSGRMPVCKECFYKKYKELLSYYNDEVKALYHICMMFDIYFDKELISKSQENISNDELGLIKTYMKNVNSLRQYKGKSSVESVVHEVLDDNALRELEDKYLNEIENLKEKKIEKNKDRIVDDFIRRKWGREYTDEECLQLEDYYEEYFDNYTHEGDYAKLDILKEICTFKLIISQAKKDRDNRTIKDFSDLISKKMADANLKPSQQKDRGEGSEDTFGVRLRIYENEKPVPGVQESLKDVDKFWKYHLRYLVKPFAMALDLAKGTYSIEDGDQIELSKELSEQMTEEVETDE